MASGTGNEQDFDADTKGDTGDLRDESSAAVSASEPPAPAPPSKICEEQFYGPPEAGGRDPSATTAASPERKGERCGKTDQKADAEGTLRQQNEQFLDRLGNSKGNYTIPHVNYQKVHITEITRHYNLLGMVGGQGVEFHSHALNLRLAYSEFRPVIGDGECFYRSFIFSYLEQVLDRQDTREEQRLLAAVKGVARQHARLGWASEFSRSHKDMHHYFTVVA